MYIYRIEHKQYRLGPYNYGCKAMFSNMYRYWSSDRCPDPSQDGISYFKYGKEFSGFQSLRHMTEWFRLRDIFRMRREGFRVYRFKVRKQAVRIGQKQVAFARHTSLAKQEVRLRQLAWHRARSILPI